jgi:hypothetical protein
MLLKMYVQQKDYTGLILWCFSCLACLIIWLFNVYLDKLNGGSNPVTGISFICFIYSFIGLLVYILIEGVKELK